MSSISEISEISETIEINDTSVITIESDEEILDEPLRSPASEHDSPAELSETAIHNPQHGPAISYAFVLELESLTGSPAPIPAVLWPEDWPEAEHVQFQRLVVRMFSLKDWLYTTIVS